MLPARCQFFQELADNMLIKSPVKSECISVIHVGLFDLKIAKIVKFAHILYFDCFLAVVSHKPLKRQEKKTCI